MGKSPQQSFPTNKDAPMTRILTPFQKFFRYEASSGIILIITVVIALFWANLNPSGYFAVWSSYFSLELGNFRLSKPLYLWINDLLMAVFFLLVGLEVKRELLVGELRNPKRAMLPIGAALGGIIVPAMFYVILNNSNPTSLRGWAIPAATDIAFALGILYLLGDRVPFSARIFLATLAIIDDIAAILIIALFYTGSVNSSYFIFAGFMFVLLIGLNRMNVRSLAPYLGIGLLMWYGFFGSGIHATIAGVFLAFTIPASIKLDFIEFKNKSSQLIHELIDITDDDQISPNELPVYQNTIAELEYSTQQVQAPLARLEHSLAPWVIYGIMPIFALANAGVVISPRLLVSVVDPVSVGIILGLFLGKPVGVVAFSFIFVTLGIAKLPEGLSWTKITGLGFLAGIGFTMSTFIASLAFEFEPAILEITKIAILIASFLAGTVGFLLLKRTADIDLVTNASSDTVMGD